MEASRQIYSLSLIPDDLLLRCVAEFLGRRDQYKLFSLCSSWRPLMHQSRIIHIKEDDTDDETDCVSNPHSWYWFKKSEEHRATLLRMCGFSDPAHRPLRLTLDFDEVVNNSALILHCVHHFDSIIVTYHVNMNYEVKNTVLTSPSSEGFARYLKSSWHLAGSVQTLQDMWEVAELASHSLRVGAKDAACNKPASFDSLRGVQRLMMTGNGSLFIEMSPESSAKLQSVVLEECDDILDVTSLRGMPDVRLLFCTEVSDVSPLAQADTIVLDGLTQLTNVSMLGNVRKLELKRCTNVAVFPKPSLGKGQEWKLQNVRISNETLSSLASLEKLTLVACSKVSDISMLGHVKYLHITCCNRLASDTSYPTPLGQFQEWTFSDMEMNNISLAKFKGLQCLTLDYCRSVIVTGLSIPTLKMVDCTMRSFLSTNPANTCNVLRLTEDVAISELDIELGKREPLIMFFSASAKARLSSLRVKNLHADAIVDLAKEDLADVDLLLVDVDCVACRKYSSMEFPQLRAEVFSSSSLRTAVELWCTDSITAANLYGDISCWDVSQVTGMAWLFFEKKLFNSNVSSWDVSNVTDMNSMFQGASSFNQSLNNWDVRNVIDICWMFFEAQSFNQPLDNWDVSNVIDMNNMFNGASSFNQSLGSWNVGNVTNMRDMFNGSSGTVCWYVHEEEVDEEEEGEEEDT